MELTDEQKDIIESSSIILEPNIITKINACAGSGKTSTLKEIALHNPDKKFLYLAFNKSIAEESKKKFPENVDVKTIHSLAFAYIKRKYGNINLVNSYRTFDIAGFFPGRTNEELYFILKDFKNFCRNSSKLHEIINQQVVELWGLIESGQMPMCHDFYLKSYQLEVNKDLDRRYDVVMLDEAQDTNWVMLSIFLNNKCAKILVGDTFQNIYGFNETVNALEKIQSNFEFALSKSFRSTQNILDYADFFLAKFSNKQRKTMVSGVENKKHTIKNKAFIARTNSSIITFIDKLIKEKKNLEEYKLLKEPSSIFKPVFNIIYFREYKLEKLDKDFAFLKNFNNLEELEEYIDQTYDIELRLALELSKKNIDFCSLEKVAKRLYNNRNPEIVNYIINAHLSKGLEWDEIELQNDFPDLEGMEIELNQLLRIKKTREASNIESSLEQELNLFYVAITRAKYVLKDLSCNSMMISRIEKQKESNKTKI